RHLGPVIGNDPSRHAAVNAADAVVMTRAVERKTGHIEVIATLRWASQTQEGFRVDLQFRNQLAQMSEHQLRAEYVVTGRDRSVRSEHAPCCYGFACTGEIESARDFLADQLDDQECRVSFVDVPDRWREPQSTQGPGAPNAEHDLLLDAHVL